MHFSKLKSCSFKLVRISFFKWERLSDLNLVHLRLNNFSFFVFDRFAFGSFQAQFSEVSLSTWKLEERILLKLVPVSFLQQSVFILGLRSSNNFDNLRILFYWIFFRIQLGPCFRKIKVDLASLIKRVDGNIIRFLQAFVLINLNHSIKRIHLLLDLLLKSPVQIHLSLLNVKDWRSLLK